MSLGVPNMPSVLASWSTSLSPLKIGPSLERSSPSMAPTDHTSIFESYVLAPNKISGARYHRVCTAPVI